MGVRRTLYDNPRNIFSRCVHCYGCTKIIHINTNLRDDEGPHGGEEQFVLGAVLVDRDAAEHALPQGVVPVVHL